MIGHCTIFSFYLSNRILYLVIEFGFRRHPSSHLTPRRLAAGIRRRCRRRERLRVDKQLRASIGDSRTGAGCFCVRAPLRVSAVLNYLGGGKLLSGVALGGGRLLSGVALHASKRQPHRSLDLPCPCKDHIYPKTLSTFANPPIHPSRNSRVGLDLLSPDPPLSTLPAGRHRTQTLQPARKAARRQAQAPPDVVCECVRVLASQYG